MVWNISSVIGENKLEKPPMISLESKYDCCGSDGKSISLIVNDSPSAKQETLP